ncbi:glycosyl hydrolase, partial [Paenibacillus sp. AR247]
ALRTAEAAKAELAADDGVFPDEGSGDGGLFKGILVRYLAELSLASEEAARLAVPMLAANAGVLWDAGRSAACLFGTDWSQAPAEPVSLSTQLSGVKLLERMAVLEKLGFADY